MSNKFNDDLIRLASKERCPVHLGSSSLFHYGGQSETSKIGWIGRENTQPTDIEIKVTGFSV